MEKKENQAPEVEVTLENEETTQTPETSEVAETPETPEIPAEEEAAPEQPETSDEAEEWKNRYIRLQADFDNFRKRMSRERQEERDRGIEAVLVPLLEINDNLKRALQAAKESADMDGLLKGVGMINSQLESLLAKFGVEKIEALDKPFDPHLHHAVMHLENDDLPENTVTAEFQAGYRRGGKVLRPSMVQVSVKTDRTQGGNDSQ
ncbi:MAG: nucleotide exchange factor GrpE [Firmicutes bacterium]|nr:nucleotide exchange factor GrpE [Bacillota bacterium]